MRSLITLFVLAAVAAGCTKDEPADKSGAGGAAAGGGKAGPAAGGVDAVLDAWKQAGLTVSVFADADGAKYGGGECKAGSVNGVDAVLCRYATPDLAKSAEAKGLAAVGDVTGSSLAHGPLLLVVADRRKADPQGQTINQATKIFRGR